MDRISWKSTFGLALAAMVYLMAAPASAGITYNVTNDTAHQNPWLLNGTITLSGTGKQVRDLLHADDMISLYFRALQRIGDVGGQAFNIGGGMVNSLPRL